MTELRVSGVDIRNWHYCGHQPLVGPATIEVRPCKFNRTRVFFRARRSVEGIRLVCVVRIADFHLVGDLRIVPSLDVVW